MRTPLQRGAVGLFTLTFLVGACSDEDRDSAADSADRAAERAQDEAGDVAEDAQEAAGDVFDTFRTGFERSIDEASSGDDKAKEDLLDQCRDTLEDLRQADDPRAEQMGALCQKIRDADDGNAWQELREEFDQISN